MLKFFLKLLPVRNMFFVALLLFSNKAFCDDSYDGQQFYHLIDLNTQEVLLSKNANVKIPPSSMTKLMTAFVIFDLVDSGLLTLDKQCVVSKEAWRKTGSSMFLNRGDIVTIDQLLRGLLAVSGNDAAVDLAINSAGSVANFAKLMNFKAREIGMKDSNFKNPHGLYEEGHYMTLRDLTTLASKFYKKFPQYIEYLSIEEFTYGNITQKNRNPLIKEHYDGVLAGKTGYTNQGGYGIIGIVKRDNRNLVGAINKAKSPRQRKDAIIKLFDYGFENYKKLEIFRKGQVVANLPTWLASEKSIPVYINKDISFNVSSEKELEDINVDVKFLGPIYAPVAKDNQVATLVIKIDGDKKFEYPLFAKKNLEKSGYFNKVKQILTFKINNFVKNFN